MKAAAEAHAAQDRLDRQQEARERRLAAEEGRPPRLPSIVDAELAASAAEFMAQPATIGNLAHLAADVGKVKLVLGRLLKKV